ncbi:MAG: CFI-box-CTERM domain-containing protein [Nostoc sp.]|uniref:CFI-box-CTERM domain-containing protein n=1 Tax=Nostoc sp. TaxID=1180 RepID=UPI002FFB0904
MNMIARGSELIQEYGDKHISLEKENTFIQDLIKAEQLGSYEARLVLKNDPDVSRLRDIYKSKNSSPKNPTNVNTNSQTTNLQTTNSQTTNSQQGDCFIATAAYSSTEHPDLDTFRNFRDSVLLSNYFGTFLVALYYKIGPSLAKYVTKNKSIQIMCRNLLSNFAKFLRKI